MFYDIRHYEPRRKDGREREPNGRLSRKAGPAEHMVYFVKLEFSPRVKVGRTKDIRRRVSQYELSSGGRANCLAQLIVSTAEESLLLERSAVKFLAQRYSRVGREWFDIPESQVGAAIFEICDLSDVVVTEIRGAPGAEEGEDIVEALTEEVRVMSRNRSMFRGGNNRVR